MVSHMNIFKEAARTKDQARGILEEAGVNAKYLMSVTDTGPRVEIHVAPADLELAHQSLPPNINRGIVKLVVKK
jgi:hypothetical protein